MTTRLSTNLGNPMLMKLLKLEAQEKSTSIKNILIKALEAYFGDRLETKALMVASEKIFEEWDDELDSDYDRL